MNLGYRFGVQAWGQGYATEVSREALAYGFEELRAPEIFAVVRPAHAASINVLRKVGMVHTDELKDVPGAAPSWVFALSLSGYRRLPHRECLLGQDIEPHGSPY